MELICMQQNVELRFMYVGTSTFICFDKALCRAIVLCISNMFAGVDYKVIIIEIC